jgi:hypothetical protein
MMIAILRYIPLAAAGGQNGRRGYKKALIPKA